MNYPYVLLSGKDGKFYIGSTNDLRQRLNQHNKGLGAFYCLPETPPPGLLRSLPEHG